MSKKSKCACKRCRTRASSAAVFILFCSISTALSTLLLLRAAQKRAKPEETQVRQQNPGESEEAYKQYISDEIGKRVVSAVLRERRLERRIILLVTGVTTVSVLLASIVQYFLA